MTVTRTRVLVALIAGLGAVALLASPTLELVAGCVRAEVWPAPLLALVTVADGLTAVAYAWIPVTLIGVWRQRRDVPASWTLVSFAAFIVLCGLTHVLAIVTAFRPLYWLAAEVQVATAAVSLVTAYLLQTRVGPILLTLQSYGDVLADRDAARDESAELQSARARAEDAERRATARAEELQIAHGRITSMLEKLEAANADAERARLRAEQNEQQARGGEAAALADKRNLEELLARVERQDRAIRELSTPILRVWTGVVALPIVGMVDSARAADMTEALLNEIASSGATHTIVDVTGVGVMDTGTVAHLAGMARAAELMGSTCVITGLRPDVARTLVASGVDLGGVETLRTLEQGLRRCLARMGRAP